MPCKSREIREAELRSLEQAAKNILHQLKNRVTSSIPLQIGDNFYNWRGFTTDEFGGFG